MKIFISYPPLQGKGFPVLTQCRFFQWVLVPTYIYPLISASAVTLLHNDGFEAVFNDCLAENWSYERFLDFIKLEQPDMVVLETKTPVIKLHWRIINQLKKHSPDVKTVLIGDHVTALPEESLRMSRVDYVIIGGNYDIALLKLARHLRDGLSLPRGIWYRDNGAIKNTGDFELIEDLNALPFINRDLTPWRLYGEKWKKRTPFAYTLAGRGCPYGKCTFCSWAYFSPIFRLRSSENLLDEIEALIEKYNVKEIFDDTGTFPSGAWLNEFCEGLIKRDFNKKVLLGCNMRCDYLTEKNTKLMRKAGFRKLKLGLESANQQTLDKLNKNITVNQIINGCKIASKAGLSVHLTIMFGYPWETKNEAMNTLSLAQELLNKGYAEMFQATIIVPYPGTPLFKEGLRNKWFRFDYREYERYDMKEPVFITGDMRPEEVLKICNSAYKIFFSPKFIFKKLFTLNTFANLTYLFRGAIAMYGHLKDFYNKNCFC